MASTHGAVAPPPSMSSPTMTMRTLSLSFLTMGLVEGKGEVKVSPKDFINFVPWAAKEYSLNFEVAVTKVFRDEYISQYSAKSKHSNVMEPVPSQVSARSILWKLPMIKDGDAVKIQAIYSGDYLVQLKLLNNKQLPRQIFQIVGFTLAFHTKLTTITINTHLDKYCIHELAKIIRDSMISELHLDNATCSCGKYDLLLGEGNNLTVLSLARCNIDDVIVQAIAEKLEHGNSGNKLRVLNLSSNRITTKGAQALGYALRTNRSLYYLNLANNSINDDGARTLFEVMQPFQISSDDVQQLRIKKMTYTRNFQETVEKYFTLLTKPKEDKSESPWIARKPVKGLTKKRRVSGQKSLLSLPEGCMANEPKDVVYGVAKDCAKKELGEFDEPFDDFTTRGDLFFCNGNRNLAYINLAYNNLTDFCLLPLLNVFIEQRHGVFNKSRGEAGLINIVIEGNPINPKNKILSQIQYFAESQLTDMTRTTLANYSTGRTMSKVQIQQPKRRARDK